MQWTCTTGLGGESDEGVGMARIIVVFALWFEKKKVFSLLAMVRVGGLLLRVGPGRGHDQVRRGVPNEQRHAAAGAVGCGG